MGKLHDSGSSMIANAASIAALLLSASIFLVGSGLQNILVPLTASLSGFSSVAIAFMATAYFFGFVLGCLLTPVVIRRAGHIRMFAVYAAFASTVALAYVLVPNEIAWIAMRVAAGFFTAGLSMAIESWLGERSTNETRGLTFSAYMVINLGSVTVGQMVLVAVDPSGFTPFALICIATALSLVPVSLTAHPAPVAPEIVKPDLRKLYRLSPVAAVGCLAVGLVNGTFWGLGPVFAHEIGLPVAGVATFMSAAVIGGAVLQLPMGRLSDRLDRRVVIKWGAVVTTITAGVLAFADRLPEEAIYLLAIPFGGFMLPLYSLCVAHAMDYAEPSDMVQSSGGLLLLYGIGAAIGPTIATSLMGMVGYQAVPTLMIIVYACLVLFILYRMRARAAMPPEERTEFATAATTTPEAFNLDPRTETDATGEAGQGAGETGMPPGFEVTGSQARVVDAPFEALSTSSADKSLATDVGQTS
jgi:MFS family permease